jgi:Acetyltransferases
MSVRFAAEADLERVNELRKQVNDLHSAALPRIFKKGFSDELRDHIHTIFNDPLQRIAVCERGGIVCGYAIINHIIRQENLYMHKRDYLDIDEFGVDEAHRRQGIASEMIDFISDYARSLGFDRIELNMWEFNRGALEFYEAEGFETYRRYMEKKL